MLHNSSDALTADPIKNPYESGLQISGLKCNYLTHPLGVETPSPRLSWILHSKAREQYQKAYRILAASSLERLAAGKADLWDSGKVESDRSIHVEYGGEPLTSMLRCYWKVCVWDQNDYASGWSEPDFFEMGLLCESDWKAKWICSPLGGTDISSPIPAPLFRKSIKLDKNVKKARAYICGLGYHELHVNGSKAGDEVLSPAFTRYDRTVLYNTYDITEMLNPGENVVGIMLGNGWYNCFTDEVWNFRQAPWRDLPKFILQMHITCEDGEELVVISDNTWKVSTGPILFDALRNGEFYDARLEKKGWNTPGYDDCSWMQAQIARGPGGMLRSFQMPPIRVTKTLNPVALKEVRPGIWVYDLGQNISGWAKIRVSGPAGTTVTLKYSEKINQDGTINQSNIGMFIKSGECQTDRYILKGEGVEVWEPRFTYHGFQYIEVTGYPGTPSVEDLCGRVVHTDFNTLGQFECSNELLNKIHHCVRWSTLTNYHGIPTDCPHREKNGWTGDASLSAEQVLMNFDPMSAYTKWLKDFKDVQRPSGQLPGIVPTGGWGYNWGSGPAWDSALILMPWYLYLYCGDASILKEMYDTMKKYVGYMNSMAVGHIVNFGLGDWCPPIGEANDHKCPTVVTDTAYYYVDTVLLAKIAALLGNKEDEAYYSKLADDIRNSFREKFYDGETGIVTGNCQTSMACALYQGLIDEEEKPKVLEKLVEQVELQDYHIDCGILGAKYILHVLSDLGRTDLAYAIATQTTFPGWGYWISQGATTLWESWSGDSSRNHHMFSDIGAWFYKGLAGIHPDPEEPGFKHIIFRPNPVEGLNWVRCSHQSMYGRIECSWEVKEREFRVDVSIPVNCRATLYFPRGFSKEISENGKPAGDAVFTFEDINGIHTKAIRLGSGEYVFTAKRS